MKRKFTLFLGMLFLGALLLSACDQSTATIPSPTPKGTIPTLPTASSVSEVPAVNPTPSSEPLPTAPDNAFGPVSDMVYDSFSLDASPDEVKAKLGTPDQSNEYTEEATGQKMMVLDYGDDELTFVQNENGKYGLNSVSCYSGTKGPRGIAVGMGLQDVLPLFGLILPKELPMEEIKIYGVNSGTMDEEGNPVILAPSGSIYQEEGLKFIHLETPAQPYPADMDPIEYVYYPHRWLNLEFGADDHLRSWTWGNGAMAE